MKPSILQTVLAGSLLALCVTVSQSAQARYETCYEQEYRCETRYEQECHTERECTVVTGRPQCHQEQVCTSTPATPEECREQNVCHINPDGSKECSREQVCRPGSPGGQSCHYEQRCEQGQPERECHDEYKCQQVPRQHCGYETVAKQCWVNDPPPPPPPPPYHPPEPPPYHPPEPPPYHPPTQPEEPPYYPPTEPEEPPYVPPTPPIEEPTEPEEPEIPVEMGEKTVTGVRLKIFADLTAAVVFKDVGQSKNDYKTEYTVRVYNEADELVIEQKIKSNGKLDQKLILVDSLTLDQDYTLKLRVVRKGGSLEQKHSFVKTFFRPGPQ